MLDDRGGRPAQVLHQRPGGVDVDDVVVRELDTLVLPHARDATRAAAKVIESRRLVRVLAVAQVRHLCSRHRELAGPALGRQATPQVGGDSAVVRRGVGERDVRQLRPGCLRHAPAAQLLENASVVRRIDHDNDRGMVLGGGA